MSYQRPSFWQWRPSDQKKKDRLGPRTSSHNYSPLSVSPHLSPRGTSSTHSPGGSALTPYYSTTLPLDDNYFESVEYLPGNKKQSSQSGDIHVTKQESSQIIGFGSPADGVLHRGDIITKVGNYDARDIRHQDAQNLFRNSGNTVRVVVKREVSQKHPTSTGSSRTSSHNYSPLSVSPHLSPRGTSSTHSPGGSALTPYYSTTLTPLDDNYFESVEYLPGNKKQSSQSGDIHVTKQPYRTTPLVLPGAKVKREPGPTESYLRHHPNPAVRAAPHHLDTDHLYKQKVANSVFQRMSTGDPNKQIVHKQFNSPITLYSESNVAETLHKQIGVSPIRKAVKFNPEESETYKAIQEEELGHEVYELKPAATKVYVPQSKKPNYVNQTPSYTNSLGQDEVIHQSGSFRRLMLSVLPETSY